MCTRLREPGRIGRPARLIGESKTLSAGSCFFATTGATCRSTERASFRDDGTLTAYAYDYTSGGKMRTATAAPDAGSTPGTLAQDYAQSSPGRPKPPGRNLPAMHLPQ